MKDKTKKVLRIIYMVLAGLAIYFLSQTSDFVNAREILFNNIGSLALGRFMYLSMVIGMITILIIIPIFIFNGNKR